MKSFTMLLSGLYISLESNYEYTYEHSMNYLCENPERTDILVSVSDDEIVKEQNDGEFEKDYCEYICLYREIAERLPLFNRTVFHGAVITYERDAYLFTAPSGTGKSTHICLWKKFLKTKVDIVNGDKPILELQDSEIYAYGTPWAGKENLQKNRSASLKGICILKQAKTNSIRQLTPSEAIFYLVNQIYLPKNEETAPLTLELLDAFVNKLPIYLLECDISEEAVSLSFEALTGKKLNEEKY